MYSFFLPIHLNDTQMYHFLGKEYHLFLILFMLLDKSTGVISVYGDLQHS